MRSLRHILRALKHHVLKQVSKPGAALGLVARANVVINADRNYRNGFVLVEDDPQTVVQRELFDGCMWNEKRSLHVNPLNKIESGMTGDVYRVAWGINKDEAVAQTLVCDSVLEFTD